jgi:signal transduction histidine kinase
MKGQEFQHLLNVIPAAVYTCDLSGRLTYYNKRAVELWGRDPGLNDSSRFCASFRLYQLDGTPLPHDQTPMSEAVRSGRSPQPNLEVIIERLDGSRIIVLVNIAVMKNPEGEPIGAINCFQDITENKRTEAKLASAAESLRRLSTHLLNAQDQERRRIALQLHETAVQDLIALKMNLAKMARSQNGSDDVFGPVMVENIMLTDGLLQELRTLSHLLHPPLLEEAGLLSALRWYVSGFSERSGIAVTLEAQADFERLPQETEIAIFRVVQEALTNIHRHSGSSSARVQLIRDTSIIQLQVKDEGKGMETNGAGHSKGVGIEGMRERVQHLGGTLVVGSNGHGTLLKVVLPIREGAS